MPDERSESLQIVAEEIHVDKRVVETDRVRVHTVVDERDVVVTDSVERGTLDVKRVTMNVEVAEAPPPREEGDTIVISLVEERLVVEKRLFLVEEVRVRKSTRTEAVVIPTSVRSTRAVIERDGVEPNTTRRN